MNSANSPTPQPESSGDGSAAAPIPLPPRIPLPTPPDRPERMWTEGLVGALVVLLAFLMASTPARNSDLWLHLATGRTLVNGGLGSLFDSGTAAEIAHSWLYDLIIFGLYQSLGGTVLVFLKAVLVAVLAALLVRFGNRGGGSVWPALGAALSILALGSRMLLQPALLSALLLVITLILLERARRLRTMEQGGWLRAYGPLCLLFVLWANLDEWFLLGLLAVGLSLLGEALASLGRGSEDEKGDLLGSAILLGAALLAALLTPSPLHAFTLPPELGLSATAQALASDPVLQGLFVSPFDGSYFSMVTARSVSGLAFLLLAVLGALSFVGSREGWRNRYLPLWLGLFALSAWSARAVPFFVMAAGPLLARNLHGLALRLRPAEPSRGFGMARRLGRVAAVLLLLGLSVVSLPGWLQGQPYERRYWAVLPDPSMRQTAEKLVEWRASGRLSAAAPGFNFSPEAANYLAWFCPDEKGVVDARLHASATAVAEYVTVRRALMGDDSDSENWRGILRERGINHVILHDSDHKRAIRVFGRLAHRPEEWFLIDVTGHLAVFGWKDPEHQTEPPQGLEFSLVEGAYHPRADQIAPPQGAERESDASAWWNDFLPRRPVDSSERDTAILLVLYFDTLQPTSISQHQLGWEASRLAEAIAAGGPTLAARLQQYLALHVLALSHAPSPQEAGRSPTAAEMLAYHLRTAFFLSQDDAPAGILLRAIRAARRAVAERQDDAAAYEILGEAYLRLARNTRERVWMRANQLPLLGRLRVVQAAAAFNQALQLQPDLIAAHAGLASLYQSLQLPDLALRHLREQARLIQARKRLQGESGEQRAAQIAALNAEAQQLEEQIKRGRDLYDLSAAKLKTVDRASLALERGLGEMALDILLRSDVGEFGRKGVQLELSLLLTTGRARDARDWMLPEHKALLGEESYRLLRLQLAAAEGDYEQAAAELRDLIALTEHPVDFYKSKVSIRQAMILALGQLLLDARLQLQSMPQRGMVIYNQQRLIAYMLQLLGPLQRRADLQVLAGILAVEQGDMATARQLFRAALDVYAPGTGQSDEGRIDFGGRPAAQRFLNLLAGPAKGERGRVSAPRESHSGR